MLSSVRPVGEDERRSAHAARNNRLSNRPGVATQRVTLPECGRHSPIRVVISTAGKWAAVVGHAVWPPALATGATFAVRNGVSVKTRRDARRTLASPAMAVFDRSCTCRRGACLHGTHAGRLSSSPPGLGTWLAKAVQASCSGQTPESCSARTYSSSVPPRQSGGWSRSSRRGSVVQPPPPPRRRPPCPPRTRAHPDLPSLSVRPAPQPARPALRPTRP